MSQTEQADVMAGPRTIKPDLARMVAGAVLYGATRGARTPVAETVDEKYKSDIESARNALIRLQDRSERSKSKDAIATHAIVAELVKRHPGCEKKQLFRDVSTGLSSQQAGTVKKSYLVVERLTALDRLPHLEKGPSSYNAIADVVLAGLGDDVTRLLLDKIQEHDVTIPAARYTVLSVRAMIAKLRPPAARPRSQPLQGDDWPCEAEDGAGGIPGDAISAALDRWLGAGTHVLAAGCGAVRATEAAKRMNHELDVRAIDSAISDADKQSHGDRVMTFDPIDSNWRATLPKDWRADLVLLVLPQFVTAAKEGQRVIGAAGEAASYIEAWRGALRGAKSVLAPKGVVAIATHPNAETRTSSDAIDIEYSILAAVHEMGLAQAFLGRVVIRPRIRATGASSVRHLSAFRSK